MNSTILKTITLGLIYINTFFCEALASQSVITDTSDLVTSTSDTINIYSEEDLMLFNSSADTLLKDNLSKLRILNPSDTAFLSFMKSYDKIITLKQNVLVVKVKKITPQYIEFLYPLNTKTSKINRDKISQILFADGQRELFKPIDISKKIISDDIIVKSEKDWEKVSSTYKKEDIPELQKIGEIEAIYEADRIKATNDYLEKNATIILKKKAANLKAHYVLITAKNIERPYGEFPFIILQGVAFGQKNICEEE